MIVNPVLPMPLMLPKISNPSPVVSTSAPSVCMSQSVMLTTSTGTGNIYQWKKDNIAIPGATLPNYSASVPGDIPCPCYQCCRLFGDFFGSKCNNWLAAPPATIAAAGPTTFCAGKERFAESDCRIRLYLPMAEIRCCSEWSNFIQLPGRNNRRLIQLRSPMPEVATTISAPINVTVNAVPVATAVAGGPLTFCSGKNVLLKATVGAGYTYQWKKGAVKLAGQTSSSFTATETGIYSVEVTNASGCSLNSSSLNVVVNAIPIATITPNGPLTFCSGKNVILRANTGTGYTLSMEAGRSKS